MSGNPETRASVTLQMCIALLGVTVHLCIQENTIKDLLQLYDRLVDLGVEYLNGQVCLADLNRDCRSNPP
jgi:hypothetical protein